MEGIATYQFSLIRRIFADRIGLQNQQKQQDASISYSKLIRLKMQIQILKQNVESLAAKDERNVYLRNMMDHLQEQEKIFEEALETVFDYIINSLLIIKSDETTPPLIPQLEEFDERKIT